ncbi:MAG TPA: hypothetical protein VKT72_06345 [Candidatus Baltobacteraceae bacterium]|nr:hypothetical protein [Candidatus Baltobacteraceae bacterium]
MHIIIAAILAAFAQTAPMPAASAMPAAAPQTATMPGQPSFGDVIASLNNMRDEIAKMQAMNGTSANNLQPVNVAQLSGADPSQLNGAISHNQSELATLRNALNRMTITADTNQRITVAQFLSDNKMTTSQIVGVHVANGKLMLFYEKP